MGLRILFCILEQRYSRESKVGVGEKPKGWDLADYVLGRYSAEDRKIIDEAQKEAAEAVKMMVMDDIRGAMNRYNTKKKA